MSFLTVAFLLLAFSLAVTIGGIVFGAMARTSALAEGYEAGYREGYGQGTLDTIEAVHELNRRERAASEVAGNTLSPKTAEQAHQLADHIDSQRGNAAWQ